MNKLNQLETPVESDPKIKQPSQKELFTSIKDGLVAILDSYQIECVRDGKYLRLEKDDEQVGIVFEMSDGNRTTVRFNSNLQTIIDDFESSISPESIFYVNRASDSVDFIFFPNLTEKDVEILQTEIEPVDGHIVIVQDEYVVVSEQDNIDLVSTFGISSCRGMIIYDSENGIAAVTHSDTEYADKSLIQQMCKDLIDKGANPTNLKFSGTPNIDLQKRQHIIDKKFSEITYKVPSKFTFDCKSGQIIPFDINSLPRSANFDQRLSEEVNIRIKHHIPYIRKNVK